MKLDFIDLGKLSVSKANMRYARKAPDVADILPTVRSRGVIVPLLVRPGSVPSEAGGCEPEGYEIVAGARRFHAARLVAEESGHAEPVPCAILEEADDADAVEASMIENMARLDPDEVSQWESFVRLVKEGRSLDDIAATFGLPVAMIRRVLALGNLLPRIRDLYRRERIDGASVRHLTMASKSQQKAWLALHDDPDVHAPTGHQLKSWLFGGQSIKAAHALFDIEASVVATVADLFGEDRYVTDADAFWLAQNVAIEARRDTYLADGWAEVVIVPASAPFQSWEYERAPKRKDGRVYIDVRASGEVVFHEGYITAKEARRTAAGGAEDGVHKVARPEVTGTMQAYIDLHRHAAVRAMLTGHPKVALRLLVAHLIAGSHLLRATPEPQATQSDAVRESVETCRAETLFDEKRRAVLALLDLDADEPTVTGGSADLAALFQRLIDLPDRAVMDVVAIVCGETLAAGSSAVEAAGRQIGVDMADWWQPDEAFFTTLRDREVLGGIVAEMAGEAVAAANRGEAGKTLKAIVIDHLAGTNGRTQVERWVPRWMTFPPAAYTDRGGVRSVEAAAAALIRPRDGDNAPEPEHDEQRLAA